MKIRMATSQLHVSKAYSMYNGADRILFLGEQNTPKMTHTYALFSMTDFFKLQILRPKSSEKLGGALALRPLAGASM